PNRDRHSLGGVPAGGHPNTQSWVGHGYSNGTSSTVPAGMAAGLGMRFRLRMSLTNENTLRPDDDSLRSSCASVITSVSAGTVYWAVGGAAAASASESARHDATISSIEPTASAAPAGVTEATIRRSCRSSAWVCTIPISAETLSAV